MAAAPTERGKRLFLAVWPGAAPLHALLRLQSLWAWPTDARPVAASRLHLTLHFLGNVADDALPGLVDALTAVRGAAGVIRLDRFALWPGGIAVAAGRADAALVDLHRALGEAVAACGLATERRPWKPHVTLARAAGSADRPALDRPVEWAAERFALVWSHPVRGYVVLQEWPLGR